MLSAGDGTECVGQTVSQCLVGCDVVRLCVLGALSLLPVPCYLPYNNRLLSHTQNIVATIALLPKR